MTERIQARSGSGLGIARAALALGALAAASGCGHVASREVKGAGATYVLTVPVDDKGCPGKPKFDLNCGVGREDCAHMRRGHVLIAVSEPKDKPFALQFDPFGRSRIEFPAQAGEPLVIGPNAKLGTYTFIVTGPAGCPAADPQIILE
jgi:hypothetical protein